MRRFLLLLLCLGCATSLYAQKSTNFLAARSLGGLQLQVLGGIVYYNGNRLGINQTNLTLTDNSTNFIYLFTPGTIQQNTTGYPVAGMPIAQVVTVRGQITNIEDDRSDWSFTDYSANNCGVPNIICVDGVTYPLNSTGLTNACMAAGSGTVAISKAIVMSGNVTCAAGLLFVGGTITTTGWILTLNGQIQAPQGSQIFIGTGTVSITSPFMSEYVAWFPGSDVGAQTQAAITSCPSNCRLWLPDQGTLSYSTPINLAVGASNGVHLVGAGEGATILTYTGVTTSPAVSFGCTSNATLEYVQITSANMTGTGVSMCGTNNKFLNSIVNGFGTTLRVTGSGTPSFVQSFKTRIQNVNVSGYSVTGIQVDHAIDTYLDSIEGFGANDNTTTQDLLVDTGTSGLYVNGLSVGYGLNGLMVQKVLNDGGAPAAYNLGPRFLRFATAFFDTIDGGDACKFDGTLGNNPVDAVFDSNSWCSAAGLNAAGTVITSTANGVGIYSGNGITFMGKARRNANNGIFINPSSNCNYIKITDAWITANNVNNNAGGNGINVNAACTNMSFSNNHIGNELDAGGNQKNGILIAAVSTDVLAIIGNHLENNATSPLSNSNTGNSWVWGNTPMVGATQNIVWGGTTLTSDISGNVKFRGAIALADQGSVCTNGELALSAGWQSTGSATATAVAGNGQTCSWTITTGTTTAANPTITDTLTNALPAATTRCWMFLEYGPASTHTAAAGEGFAQTTLSATAPVFTFNGTPTAAGKTYLVVRTCGP